MLQHYVNSYLYLDSYVGLARYLRVPLGNVPSDHLLFGADLAFARALKAANHVLWASPRYENCLFWFLMFCFGQVLTEIVKSMARSLSQAESRQN